MIRTLNGDINIVETIDKRLTNIEETLKKIGNLFDEDDFDNETLTEAFNSIKEDITKLKKIAEDYNNLTSAVSALTAIIEEQLGINLFKIKSDLGTAYAVDRNKRKA